MNEGPGLPPIPPATSPTTDFKYASSQVSVPAIGLLVIAILDIIGNLISISISFVREGFVPFIVRSRVYNQLPHMFDGTVNIGISIAGLLVSGFVVYAALMMRELKQWELCIAASILYIIPCVSGCCILGIPFGIWSLVVLMKPDVKEAFYTMT